MNILLVAEESAGIQALRAVARGRHRLVAVMTAPQTRGGGATVKGVAEGLGVPILASKQVREARLAEWIREQDVDLLLNVHSLYLVHADVVRAPRIGSFNLHPGPLPEYAGLNAPSWAIYNGARRHGVTLHWMEPEIDTGAIAYAATFELTPNDTGLSVSARCVREGMPLVERLLATAEGDPSAVPAIPQDLSRRRYFARDEVPDGGRIVWSRPARRIVDFVRACDYLPFASPWGHPTARLGARTVGVLKAARTHERADSPPGTVGTVDKNGARVAAADEWVVVRRVELEGRRLAAGDVFEPGSRLESGVTAVRISKDRDRAVVAALVHEAGNPYYDWLFGHERRAADTVATWMRRPSSEVYEGRVHVFYDDGEVAGMYLALSGEELGPCRRADGLALLAETGHDADARAKLAAHLEAANGLFPPVAADEFYLSKIGVTPSYRGRGFGRTLTGRFLDEGAGLGFSRFRLDVSADNAPAVHVYESLGFRVDVETERAGMRYFSMVRG